MNAFKTQYLSFSADDPYPLSTPRFHCSCEDNASYQQSEMAKRKTLRKKTGRAKTQGFRFASHVCSVQRLLFHTFQPTWYVLLEQENSPDWRETQIMPNGVIHRL